MLLVFYYYAMGKVIQYTQHIYLYVQFINQLPFFYVFKNNNINNNNNNNNTVIIIQ